MPFTPQIFTLPFRKWKIGFYIVDYPILAVENTFLSQNTEFCKRCENMYTVYNYAIHTSNIHIIISKVEKSDST